MYFSKFFFYIKDVLFKFFFYIKDVQGVNLQVWDQLLEGKGKHNTSSYNPHPLYIMLALSFHFPGNII